MISGTRRMHSRSVRVGSLPRRCRLCFWAVQVLTYAWMAGSFFLVWIPEAHAAKARITRVSDCKAFIRGRGLSAGDEAVFVGLQRGRRVLIPVQIDRQVGRGRYLGTITDRKRCPYARGARHSPGATAEQEKDLFVARASLEMGYEALTQKGLNIPLGDGEQNLPALVIAGIRLMSFPLVLTERGFFGQSMGFVFGFESALPVGEAWEVDDGGLIQPSWLAWEAGLMVRPYWIGSAHPTELSLAFTSFSLGYELTKSVTYQRSVLRPLSCSSVEFGLGQTLGITNDLSLSIGGAVQPASSCTTDAISEAESKALEAQQKAAGVPDDRLQSAPFVEVNADLIDPFVFRVSGSFSYAFSDTVLLFIRGHYASASGKLQHLDSQRAVSLRMSGILIGIDLTWGAD
jgi:hypothetical protein